MPDPTNPIEEPSGRRDSLAENTLRQFRESGLGHFLDNADADTLREMVRLSVADHEQAVRELRADLSTIVFLLTEGREANRLNALDRARSALARTGGQDG